MSPSPADESGTASIQVIERLTHLLHLLQTYQEPMSLKRLSQLSNLHPSTTHRILNNLIVKRMVERTPEGEYKLGLRLLELGNIVRSRLDIRGAALHPMRRLHHCTEQTVNLAVRQNDEIVYVDRAFAERSGMQVVRALGDRAPLHLTSTGKLFLANEPVDEVTRYILRSGLPGHNRNSLTAPAALQDNLNRVRRDGFARDNEELELGVRCIAAAIFEDSGRLVAGLSISAPAERLRDDWIPLLLETAAEISAALGYTTTRT